MKVFESLQPMVSVCLAGPLPGRNVIFTWAEAILFKRPILACFSTHLQMSTNVMKCQQMFGRPYLVNVTLICAKFLEKSGF